MAKSLFLSLLLTLINVAHAATHHELKTLINPLKHEIFVTDTITLKNPLCQKLELTLHSNLKLTLVSPKAGTLRAISEEVADPAHKLKVTNYELDLPCGTQKVTLSYKGEIYHPVSEPDDSYSRSGADSPGLISSEGVVLAPSTYWYPQLKNIDDGLSTFVLTAKLPPTWMSVSQGNKNSFGQWVETNPQEEIYLIAYQFTHYEKILPNGLIVEAYMREADQQLATKYLDATEGYLLRYSNLIGPYPYQKFALVENFWDTGFGMPSFTLLGSNVIRLPFIINSSYPHEILHDWWGNSVYVDYNTGNWCEGLTTYLADHLMAEIGLTGEGYRRDSLQKFTDYVTPANDFPLSKFLGRDSNFSEAIGYGKSSIFFHMLRREVGDLAFKSALSDFFENNKFKQASYSDIKSSFEKVTGKNLHHFFDQWINRTGAPKILLTSATTTPTKTGFDFRATLKQSEESLPFTLKVLVAIHLEGAKKALIREYLMEGNELVIEENFDQRVVWIEIDPYFDLMRKISRDEVPVAISMALGSKKTTFIVTESEATLWREFATKMSASLPEGSEVSVLLDSEIKTLPTDHAVWILGNRNRFVSEFEKSVADQGVLISGNEIELQGQKISMNNKSLMLLGRDFNNKDQLLVFISHDNLNSLATFVGKIVHYGKYSFIGFEGEKVVNKQKGIWKINRSTMSIPVTQTDGATVDLKKGELEIREALTH